MRRFALLSSILLTLSLILSPALADSCDPGEFPVVIQGRLTQAGVPVNKETTVTFVIEGSTGVSKEKSAVVTPVNGLFATEVCVPIRAKDVEIKIGDDFLGKVLLDTYVPRAITAETLGSNVFTNGGRMGIGTIYPQELLDVVGSAIFRERVGIGKTKPKTALDVAGTVTATKFIGDGSELIGLTTQSEVTSAISTALGGITTEGDKVGIGVRIPQAELDIKGDLLVRGNAVGTTAPVLRLTYDHVNTRGLISSVFGEGVGSLYIKGKDIVLETGRGTATNKFVIKEDGKVGIGTDSPSTKLDVAGTVRATNFIGDGSGLIGLTTHSEVTSAISSALGVSTLTGATDKWDKNVDNDLTIEQVKSVILLALGAITTKSDKVGIGVDDPQAVLDVAGDVKATGGFTSGDTVKFANVKTVSGKTIDVEYGCVVKSKSWTYSAEDGDGSRDNRDEEMRIYCPRGMKVVACMSDSSDVKQLKAVSAVSITTSDTTTNSKKWIKVGTKESCRVENCMGDSCHPGTVYAMCCGFNAETIESDNYVFYGP